VRAGAATDPASAELGAALADTLLPAQVRARVRAWSHVTVIGADLLGSVPFEALPFDASTLGRRIATSHLTSLPLANLLARAGRMPPDASGLVVVAAPTLAGDAHAPIPFDEADAARLVAAASPERTRVFAGQDATRDALGPGELAGARCLVLLTHGVQRPEFERPAALLLGRDGRPDLVDSTDVEALRAPPLVLVWACGAALGPNRRGEDEPQHLGGAFLAAGARAVVVSPVELEYEIARDLAVHVLERVFTHGDTPAEALRRARLAVGVDPGRALVQLYGLGGEPVADR